MMIIVIVWFAALFTNPVHSLVGAASSAVSAGLGLLNLLGEESLDFDGSGAVVGCNDGSCNCNHDARRIHRAQIDATTGNSVVVSGNGCGADSIPTGMTDAVNAATDDNNVGCCYAHDTCYGTAGRSQSDCDSAFQSCLEGAGIVFSTFVTNMIGRSAYYDAQKQFTECASIDCSYTQIAHSPTISQAVLDDNSVTVECDAGYKAENNDNVASCSDGVLSAVTCVRDLTVCLDTETCSYPPVANSDLDSVITLNLGQSRTITCNPGFQRRPGASLTIECDCTNYAGTAWRHQIGGYGLEPECETLRCPHTFFDGSNHGQYFQILAGETRTITCNHGYSGGGLAQCGADGQWAHNYDQIKCTADPVVTDFGSTGPRKIVYGNMLGMGKGHGSLRRKPIDKVRADGFFDDKYAGLSGVIVDYDTPFGGRRRKL